MKKFTLLAITFALLASGQERTQAASYVDYGPLLGGTTSNYRWESFTVENRPGGVSGSINGTAGQWSAGILPTNSAANAKFAGTPGFGSDVTDFLGASSGGGIYSFMSNTHYSVTNTSPILDLKSITFQLYYGEGSPSILTAAPTLTLATTNGPVVAMAASFSLQSTHTLATVLGNPTFLDLQGYQWDLSAVTGTITGYSIDWQNSTHTIIYGMDLAESNNINTSSVLAIPEPSTYALMGIGGIAMAVWAGKRRRMMA